MASTEVLLNSTTIEGSTNSSSTVTTSDSINVSSIESTSSSTLSPQSSIAPPAEKTTSYTTLGSSNKTTDFHQDESEAAEAVVAIIVVLVVVATCLVLVFVVMRRKGKLSKLPCYRPISRSRRSSTASSRRALEENEVMENSVRPHLQETTDDMFAIEDYEDTPGRPEGKEEYYYDEVFGQSQFEDETTNNAMRQLYHDGSNNQPEEEMLDFDFETLGIKIDDYTPEAGRKYTM